jgi:hypothetical protein
MVGEGDLRPPQFLDGDVSTPLSDPSPPPQPEGCAIGKVGFCEALELSIGEVGKRFLFFTTARFHCAVGLVVWTFSS